MRTTAVTRVSGDVKRARGLVVREGGSRRIARLMGRRPRRTMPEEFVDQAIAMFPDKVEEYRSGKKGLVGLFMGQVMKLSKGKADPKLANQLVVKKLES